MQIFKTRYFSAWAENENLKNASLVKAIQELSQGLNDGKLGSHCYKKRIGLADRSKRDGARLIIAFQFDNKAFFIYGYAKNKKIAISEKELLQYQKLAKIFLNLSIDKIEKLVNLGDLIEVLK